VQSSSSQPVSSGGARAIFQPLPVIPPDLRRHVLNLVAVVRFTIAIDGSASAELVDATPDPRLNQILLDTFRRWRFFPEIADGRPVASILMLRVPVHVE
jgi:protein TonB